MLARFPDWELRLHRYLLGSVMRKFQYGEMDCCLFVADAVLAMTGTDIAAEYRGRYRSAAEAERMIQAATGRKSVRLFLRGALSSLPLIPILCAQRGDIVMIRRARSVSLGLVGLNGKEIVAASAKGFCRFSVSRALAAWRV